MIEFTGRPLPHNSQHFLPLHLKTWLYQNRNTSQINKNEISILKIESCATEPMSTVFRAHRNTEPTHPLLKMRRNSSIKQADPIECGKWASENEPDLIVLISVLKNEKERFGCTANILICSVFFFTFLGDADCSKRKNRVFRLAVDDAFKCCTSDKVQLGWWQRKNKLYYFIKK